MENREAKRARVEEGGVGRVGRYSRRRRRRGWMRRRRRSASRCGRRRRRGWRSCTDVLACLWCFLESPVPAAAPLKVQSVDDFVPDERLDKSFLEDSLPVKTKMPPPAAAAAVGDSDR